MLSTKLARTDLTDRECAKLLGGFLGGLVQMAADVETVRRAVRWWAEQDAAWALFAASSHEDSEAEAKRKLLSSPAACYHLLRKELTHLRSTRELSRAEEQRYLTELHRFWADMSPEERSAAVPVQEPSESPS